MPKIPRDRIPDSTLPLLLQGYRFISNRCRRHQSDLFQTRLLLQKTICMKGEEAAEVFYDEDRFLREGAAPGRLLKTLFGEGGVQGLDGKAHRHRKEMFMSIASPERVDRLAAVAAAQWEACLQKWEHMDKVVLFFEVQEIFCRVVCKWAGVPLPEREVKKRTKDIRAMIEGPGAVGPRYWRGRFARKRAEKWIGDIVDRVRTGDLKAPKESALDVVAHHRGLDGELLDRQVAAVELINVLRPTVAVARFVTFEALALHEHPETRWKLQSPDGDYAELFVQEVRRFYPFFPMVVAKVSKSFEWNGYPFPRGRRVVLDLYGTDHDERLWEWPEEFRPERFRRWNESAFNFISQGGGDHHINHRCPGEWIAMELMKVGLNFLTKSMRYDVPKQDLRISLSRMPAIPRSRFVMKNIRRIRPEAF